MMPGEDGLAILRALDRSSSPPVIILSVIGQDIRIVGLELGADDYIAKPTNPRELLARIRSVLRRGVVREPAAPSARSWRRFAGWRFHPVGRELIDPDGVLMNLPVVVASPLTHAISFEPAAADERAFRHAA